jgi:hypothetical protein
MRRSQDDRPNHQSQHDLRPEVLVVEDAEVEVETIEKEPRLTGLSTQWAMLFQAE